MILKAPAFIILSLFMVQISAADEKCQDLVDAFTDLDKTPEDKLKFFKTVFSPVFKFSTNDKENTGANIHSFEDFFNMINNLKFAPASDDFGELKSNEHYINRFTEAKEFNNGSGQSAADILTTLTTELEPIANGASAHYIYQCNILDFNNLYNVQKIAFDILQYYKKNQAAFTNSDLAKLNTAYNTFREKVFLVAQNSYKSLSPFMKLYCGCFLQKKHEFVSRMANWVHYLGKPEFLNDADEEKLRKTSLVVISFIKLMKVIPREDQAIRFDHNLKVNLEEMSIEATKKNDRRIQRFVAVVAKHYLTHMKDISQHQFQVDMTRLAFTMANGAEVNAAEFMSIVASTYSKFHDSMFSGVGDQARLLRFEFLAAASITSFEATVHSSTFDEFLESIEDILSINIEHIRGLVVFKEVSNKGGLIDGDTDVVHTFHRDLLLALNAVIVSHSTPTNKLHLVVDQKIQAQVKLLVAFDEYIDAQLGKEVSAENYLFFKFLGAVWLSNISNSIQYTFRILHAEGVKINEAFSYCLGDRQNAITEFSSYVTKKQITSEQIRTIIVFTGVEVTKTFSIMDYKSKYSFLPSEAQVMKLSDFELLSEDEREKLIQQVRDDSAEQKTLILKDLQGKTFRADTMKPVEITEKQLTDDGLELPAHTGGSGKAFIPTNIGGGMQHLKKGQKGIEDAPDQTTVNRRKNVGGDPKEIDEQGSDELVDLFTPEDIDELNNIINTDVRFELNVQLPKSLGQNKIDNAKNLILQDARACHFKPGQDPQIELGKILTKRLGELGIDFDLAEGEEEEGGHEQRSHTPEATHIVATNYFIEKCKLSSTNSLSSKPSEDGVKKSYYIGNMKNIADAVPITASHFMSIFRKCREIYDYKPTTVENYLDDQVEPFQGEIDIGAFTHKKTRYYVDDLGSITISPSQKTNFEGQDSEETFYFLNEKPKKIDERDDQNAVSKEVFDNYVAELRTKKSIGGGIGLLVRKPNKGGQAEQEEDPKSEQKTGPIGKIVRKQGKGGKDGKASQKDLTPAEELLQKAMKKKIEGLLDESKQATKPHLLGGPEDIDLIAEQSVKKQREAIKINADLQKGLQQKLLGMDGHDNWKRDPKKNRLEEEETDGTARRKANKSGGIEETDLTLDNQDREDIGGRVTVNPAAQKDKATHLLGGKHDLIAGLKPFVKGIIGGHSGQDEQLEGVEDVFSPEEIDQINDQLFGKDRHEHIDLSLKLPSEMKAAIKAKILAKIKPIESGDIEEAENHINELIAKALADIPNLTVSVQKGEITDTHLHPHHNGPAKELDTKTHHEHTGQAKEQTITHPQKKSEGPSLVNVREYKELLPTEKNIKNGNLHVVKTLYITDCNESQEATSMTSKPPKDGRYVNYVRMNGEEESPMTDDEYAEFKVDCENKLANRMGGPFYSVLTRTIKDEEYCVYNELTDYVHGTHPSGFKNLEAFLIIKDESQRYVGFEEFEQMEEECENRHKYTFRKVWFDKDCKKTTEHVTTKQEKGQERKKDQFTAFVNGQEQKVETEVELDRLQEECLRKAQNIALLIALNQKPSTAKQQGNIFVRNNGGENIKEIDEQTDPIVGEVNKQLEGKDPQDFLLGALKQNKFRVGQGKPGFKVISTLDNDPTKLPGSIEEDIEPSKKRLANKGTTDNETEFSPDREEEGHTSKKIQGKVSVQGGETEVPKKKEDDVLSHAPGDLIPLFLKGKISTETFSSPEVKQRVIQMIKDDPEFIFGMIKKLNTDCNPCAQKLF